MKISIITINYNNARGLEKTINSVISQTYTDYEYIVIDGGSIDGSLDILNKYNDKIDLWISEPDKGIYNAMNKGILKATGEYLLFLNSGDYFVNEYVLNSVFDGKKYNTSIIRGNQITDFGSHREKWNNFGNREVTLYDLYQSSLHHQATFFKANLFNVYGYYNEGYKIVSDWEFSLRLLLGGEQSIYIDTDIAVYEYGGISSNTEGLKLRVIEREDALNRLLPKYIQEDYQKLKSLTNSIRVNTFEDNIAHFITINKLPHFIFRVINKIYKILNVGKQD